MKRIAIIADDLTGALDTASPFACRGMETVCLTSPEGLAAGGLENARVIAVSTNSRHMHGRAAADIARQAAAMLKPWQPDLVLKKIDSRLKGNVAAESASVATELGKRKLLVVPAAPDIGRHVMRAAVTGHGVEKPISILDVFAGLSIAVEAPDVGTSEDMRDVAHGLLHDKNTLAVCSRGLALALAEIFKPRSGQSEVYLAQPALIGIGSRDPITSVQVDRLCSHGGFVCRSAGNGRVPDNLPAAARLLLRCSGVMSENARAVARRFAGGLCDLILRLQPKTLLLSGGDTASAVLNRLGRSLLAVRGEVAAGLPVSLVHLGNFNLNFISKSGGFGGPDTLLDLFPDNLTDSTEH